MMLDNLPRVKVGMKKLLFTPYLLAFMMIAFPGEGKSLTKIYTDDEVKYCGGFISKGPNFAVGDGYVYTVNGCGRYRREALNASTSSSSRRRHLDSVAGHIIVFKSSSDGGKTWSNFQKVSGKGSDNVNYGSSKIVYDKKGKNLILQFMKYPTGDTTNPAGARWDARAGVGGSLALVSGVSTALSASWGN